MSEEQQDVIKEKSPWYMTVLKVIFFACAFFLIVFTVMANIGGSADIYKESIEDYISEATRHHARIAKLNDMSLFPSVRFDFEGLEIYQDEEDVTPASFVKHFQLSSSFWDVSFSTGKIKNLNIEGFVALPGVVAEEAIQIASMRIVSGEEGAYLRAEGHIGTEAVSAQMLLDVFGVPGARKYRLASETGVDIEFSDKRIEGIFFREESGQVVLKVDALYKNGVPLEGEHPDITLENWQERFKELGSQG